MVINIMESIIKRFGTHLQAQSQSTIHQLNKKKMEEHQESSKKVYLETTNAIGQ